MQNYSGDFPVVQKWRSGGYDGHGVNIIKTAEELKSAKAVDSVFEEMVDIKMEISVLIARDKEGHTAIYEPAEMIFDPVANLVDYLIAPARLSSEKLNEAKDLAKQMADKFDFYGMYAIEMFIDQNDNILINEVAPRTHNSGHHTVSANATSQYEQQIRIALGFPLGSTKQLSPCVLFNLLGADATGKTHYQGLKEAFEIENVQYVFYAKEEVRPKRKMGHAIILEEDINLALKKVEQIRNTLTITTNEQ